MAYGESIGHVIDDVTCPRKVKVVTPKCLGAIISKRLEIQPRLQQSTYRKWHMGIKWSHDRWCPWSVNRELGMFQLKLKKGHGIGQTPCSYERYLFTWKYRCTKKSNKSYKCTQWVNRWCAASVFALSSTINYIIWINSPARHQLIA